MPSTPPIPRSLQFALFLVGCLWLFAAYLAATNASLGIAGRFHLVPFQPLLQQTFFLFLLVLGFSTIQWTATRHGDLRTTNALPTRATAKQEWQRGAALGWAMLLVTVLPMMLVGDLYPQLSLQLSSWTTAAISIATLAVAALATEVAFRGYLFTRLIGALNPVLATTLLSLICALASIDTYSTGRTVLAEFLFGILLSIAYLRTHALWLGWGLRFGFTATTAILFGLPMAGKANLSSLVLTNSYGYEWFTGGLYGPQGSILFILVTLAAIPLLYRMTREYAWEYTHPEIVSAGYPMDIAPPAAHTAMEAAAAAAPAPLVQILGTTSTNASTMPVIAEHLQRESSVREE